jgi:hypothetical protein
MKDEGVPLLRRFFSRAAVLAFGSEREEGLLCVSFILHPSAFILA